MPHRDLHERNEFKRQWRLSKVADMRELLGGKCAVCGATTLLEIHHKDPAEKSFDPSRAYAWHRVVEELKKCELLCESCHYDKHGRAQHGSRCMYIKFKCRCELCVRANSDYMRQYERTEKYLAHRREWKRRKRLEASLAR